MKKFTIEKLFKYVGLLMIYGSIAAVIYVVMLGVETSAQAKWPTVEAEVLRAEFKQIVGRLRDDPEAPGGKREIYHWIPDFQYVYTVNGQQYTSNQISVFDATCRSESDVFDLRRLILRENKIIAYYDPLNPAFAVVNPFASLVNIWIALIVSVVSGLTGLSMFLVCRNA